MGKGRTCVTLLGSLVLSAGVTSQPADRAELQALRAQVQQLEAQLKALSQELKRQERAAARPETTLQLAATKPTLTTEPPETSPGVRGAKNGAADEANTIRLRALLQTDARMSPDDVPGGVHDTLQLRRARLIAEGSVAKRVGFQFTTEFAGPSATILDANVTLRLHESVQLKAGKFKTPIGLEVLQPVAATWLTERSLVTGMLPNRDVGFQLGGALAGGRVDYAVGVFNGVADGTSGGNVDADEERHMAGRVMVSPFAGRGGSAGRGLTFGVGGGGGRQRGGAARPPVFRTPGQQAVFSYLPGVAAGEVWRYSPQLDFRRGPLGVMAEYVVSHIDLEAAGAGRRSLQHAGWQFTAGFVLTGEDSTYGQLAPKADFDPAAGSWGAVEVVARYAEVGFDDAAFPGGVVAPGNASGLASYALGLNWFLSEAVVLKLNYHQTELELDRSVPFAAPMAARREDEQVLVTRFQLAF